jgi:hypothetical protein
MDLHLTLESQSETSPLSFHVQTMINAGYVGRNQAEVRRHIEELAAKGIPAPKSTPVLFPKIPRNLVTDTSIEVYGEETSGELEYVLLIQDKNEILVGLGSDHTDRKLEETDIPRSKQVCPNVLSRTVWPLAEVLDHWDALLMRCDVTKDGLTTPYQKTRLEAILAPDELISLVASRVDVPLEGAVIFSGTVGLLSGEFINADRFEAELVDEVLKRKLSLAYDILPLRYVVAGEE